LGDVTQEFVFSFCEAFNQRFPDFGRDQIEFAIAQFLHPFYKGSLLMFDKNKAKYDATVEQIRDIFKYAEDNDPEENQSIRGGSRPSPVLKIVSFLHRKEML
jgi:hypothetical protein